MHVFFRVDAGPEAGSGHFIRCRLIARTLSEYGISASFVTSTPDNVLLQEAAEEGFPIIRLADKNATDAPAIVTAVRKTTSEGGLLVVDDHRADFHTRSFQEQIRQSGLKLLMISFRHEPHFLADSVLNQNPLALEFDYSTEDYTDLLLGPEYAILDPAYRKLRPDHPKVRGQVGTVLITFGGADHTNQTERVVNALARIESLLEQVIVVVGAMYQDTDALGRQLDSISELNTKLHVNTSRMPELMAKADLAVSSGGLTAWELACLGVPNAILSTAYTQRRTGQLLDRKGYATHIGHFDEVTSADIVQILNDLCEEKSRRREMAQRSWELVDGYGTQRVVGHISDLLGTNVRFSEEISR